MAVSRTERREERRARVEAVFGAGRTRAALDLLEMLELAWHHCYREITPDESIVDEILICSEGDLEKLIAAARLAVTDWRDLKMAAAKYREAG